MMNLEMNVNINKCFKLRIGVGVDYFHETWKSDICVAFANVMLADSHVDLWTEVMMEDDEEKIAKQAVFVLYFDSTTIPWNLGEDQQVV